MRATTARAKTWRVVVAWNVEAPDQSTAQSYVWDAIDGHIGITACDVFPLLSSAESD